MIMIVASPAVINGRTFDPSTEPTDPELLPIVAPDVIDDELPDWVLLAADVENPEMVEPDKLAK